MYLLRIHLVDVQIFTHTSKIFTQTRKDYYQNKKNGSIALTLISDRLYITITIIVYNYSIRSGN